MVSIKEQVRRKILLEKRLKPKLKKLFVIIARDTRLYFRANRNIPNLDRYKNSLISILENHYRDVVNKFKDVVSNQKSRRDNMSKTEIKADPLLEQRLLDYINQHANDQALYLLGTTRKLLAQVVAEQIILNPDFDNDQLARSIEVELNERNDNRIDTITTTETQIVAEFVKLKDAEQVSEGKAMVKTWHAILDERTRSYHANADRQTVNINQPFVVNGELLNVPGDTSLGASIGNIANCRCTVTYHEKA